MFSSPSEIEGHIVQIYKALLNESTDWRPTLDGIVYDSLDSLSLSWLERAFEENEVYQVV